MHESIHRAFSTSKVSSNQATTFFHKSSAASFPPRLPHLVLRPHPKRASAQAPPPHRTASRPSSSPKNTGCGIAPRVAPRRAQQRIAQVRSPRGRTPSRIRAGRAAAPPARPTRSCAPVQGPAGSRSSRSAATHRDERLDAVLELWHPARVRASSARPRRSPPPPRGRDPSTGGAPRPSRSALTSATRSCSGVGKRAKLYRGSQRGSPLRRGSAPARRPWRGVPRTKPPPWMRTRTGVSLAGGVRRGEVDAVVLQVRAGKGRFDEAGRDRGPEGAVEGLEVVHGHSLRSVLRGRRGWRSGTCGEKGDWGAEMWCLRWIHGL
ncbi:hypothetical protein B0H14DRAFT_2630661 [Mycena olivaceomarginata]|nr:hypothetical protein B0H14DRAFT_2630661 [Mycena olivaceomarginata]